MLSVQQVASQTCCSAGAPLTTTFQIAEEEKNVISTQLKFTHRSINRLVENQEVLKNDPRTRLGNNLLFKTDYTLGNRFAISAVIPYVFQSRTTFSESQSSAGIGDIMLIGQYGISIKKDTKLSFSLGTKWPTGKVSHRSIRGIVLSPDMQSGSGTIDVLFGTSLIKRDFLVKNLTSILTALYRKNTTNNNFGDSSGVGGRRFKFGDEILVDFTLAHQQVWGVWFASPYLNLNYRYATANREQGQISPNSGGQWLSIQSGVQFSPKERYSFKVYGQIPFIQSLDGLQITTDFEVGVEFNYKIKPKKKQQPFNR